MPKKRLTRAEKQALTRADVLDAAERVFPRRGYHQTSVEEVAEQAGLSIGAVYSNFANKADLFLAVYGRQVERWTEEMERRVLAGATPDERIRAAGLWWAGMLRDEQAWLLLELEFWAHAVRDRKLRKGFAELYAPLRRATGTLIERAAADFDLELPRPAPQLALAVSALAMGLMVEKLLDPEGVDDDAFARLLESILPGGPV